MSPGNALEPNGDLTIHFLGSAGPADGTVLMSFSNPVETYAILNKGAPGPKSGPDVLHISLSPIGTGLHLADPDTHADMIYVKARGVDLWWSPGRAVLQCAPEEIDNYLAAVVEFAHYEGALRRLEREIAGSWATLRKDKALAFDVTARDLGQSDAVGERMAEAFDRRILYARAEPHILAPDTVLSFSAQKLGEGLRERASMEARAEVVDGQMEVFEHVYEMSSQRLGEFRAARQSHLMEWAIILLLALESLLMIAQFLLRVGGTKMELG